MKDTTPRSKSVTTMLVVAATLCLVLTPEFAMATTTSGSAPNGSALICWIASYFKQIVGAMAILAGVMWAVEHIGGRADLHQLVVKIMTACAVVGVLATWIGTSGLGGCTGF